MNALIVPVLLLLALCGCSSRGQATSIPSGAPPVVFSDCRRSNDSTFSKREQDIIDGAHRHLERSDKRPIDAYYRLKHTADGYEVFVIYVGGYRGSRPIFMPGGHCTVLLREDGSVIRVLGGA